MSDRGWRERAWYVIRVRGLMEPVHCQWFGGLAMSHDSSGDTVLSGEIVDRAAFYGLMSRARDLGLAVLSVERRECDEKNRPGNSPAGPSFEGARDEGDPGPD